ncbi:mCG1028705, partial [Mus musculus]
STGAKEPLFRVPLSSSAWVVDISQPSLLKVRRKPPSLPTKDKPDFPLFTLSIHACLHGYTSSCLSFPSHMCSLHLVCPPQSHVRLPSDPMCLPHVQKDSLLWSAFSSLKKNQYYFLSKKNTKR